VAAILADDELRITRVFDAPAELVFELWSKPEHLRNWMGPEGYDCPVAEIGLAGTTMHKTDERVSLADLERLTKIYEAVLDAYFAKSAA